MWNAVKPEFDAGWRLSLLPVSASFSFEIEQNWLCPFAPQPEKLLPIEEGFAEKCARLGGGGLPVRPTSRMRGDDDKADFGEQC
jgi:hypothetical protein